MVKAGTGSMQPKTTKYFPNSNVVSEFMPGNVACVEILDSNDTFDLNQAQNTAEDAIINLPFDAEVVSIQYVANAAQVYTDDNLEIGLVISGNNIADADQAIAIHQFADGAAAGAVATGVYQSADTDSNVLKAGQDYKVAIHTQPTGGIVAAVAKKIKVWYRMVASAEG